ncbi:MAG TPA: adenylate/guanylate cyclase domain-containing protein [Thermoanaerobaculia bacterium]|jgi:class 3 adenylate cyclase/tetratricopeptide (TPR) repeat protein|nr:adenylate/guanylate cyclase domain-containing protein [Thermoanaerobaculia bacterium]
MKCQQCTFENPPGMKFCGQCGAKLAPLCPSCGTENPPGFKFCGECGKALLTPEVPSAALVAAAPLAVPAPAAAPEQAAAPRSYTPAHLADEILQSRVALEGERKQVTVLFCDLVSSTALADRLGPETMHVLLNRFFELALAEIHRYEGTINQFLGDGFMALFGAPIAHEDHARRALLAAISLQGQMRDHRADLGEPHGVDLKIRMGVNTGWVVVGGIGDHLRMDYTAVGDTTNLAARLQQIAEPGVTLASEATARLVDSTIQMEPLEPVHVKGKEKPIRPFKVIGVARRQSEQNMLSGTSLSPFVGRQRERAALEELRDLAAAGEGQVLGLTGEAGSGKSRLLHEFRSRSWDGDGDGRTVWLSGRCLSYGSGVPYLPILHMLRNAWNIGESDGSATVAARVRSGLEEAGMDAEESLPYLLRLLGVDEGTESLADLSPQALQTRTSAILRQVIFNADPGGLVVLAIEDLHWIDETSEAFLDFLIEGMAMARILLILTYRSGYLPRWLGKSFATQIALRRLTDRESQVVVEAVLHRAELPGELVGTILSKADGNPFFLEELTRSLMEHPTWAGASVPDTIHDVLMARIDRLPEMHKRLLQTASVLGREFPLDLLTSIWDRPEEVQPLLSDLKRWEFLYEAPSTEEAVYFFKHALTQEAVYQSLLTGRRQALHAAVGRAFETLYASHLEDVYDSLSYHYSRAGKPAKAVSYLSSFAGRSVRGYAHAEAAKALREALSHAEHLPVEERDRRTLKLVTQLAESLLPLARFPETLQLLLQHRETLVRTGDASLAGPHYFWLAHTYSYLGNQEEVERNANLAIAAARESGDGAMEGKACYVLSRDAFWAGRFSEGIGQGLQAVALLERGVDRWWQGQAYWVAGFHHYVLGQFEQALQAMERAHAIWQALADPRLDPSWSTGYFYATLGEWERGIAECRGGLERAQDPLNTAAALGFLGYALLEKGDLPAAVEALEDAVHRMEDAGMQQLQGWFQAFLAEAYLASGRAREARETALRAIEVTGEVRFWYGLALAHRALGRVLVAGADHEGAAEHFRQALKGFADLQVPFEVARTRLNLALLARDLDDAEEAGRELAEAYRVFSQLRTPRYMERVEQLADSCSP